MICNQDQFFREVAIRICGSLEVEKALWSCLLFLRDIMPVDELQMNTYERETGSLRIVAIADMTGGRTASICVPLPLDLRRHLDEMERYPRVRKANTSEDPFSRYVYDARGIPDDSSVLVSRLVVEKNYIGTFVARVTGRDRYTDEHMDLWALVNEPAAIALANNLRYKEVLSLKDSLLDDKFYLQKELRKNFGEKLIGAESGLRNVMERVRMVAPLGSPVLLNGETGTGKEVIANAIHDLSPRADGPLIKVNCGAIPETLIDSELFGHEKGAFTGATIQKRGRFERAHGGTIFLDEVSELPYQAQLRLLRVLQEKEFERVGGTTSVKADVRVLSATNRNLEDLVVKGQFREDLYFRLNVFPIMLPPLRERKYDIPALVDHFIPKKCREMGLQHVPRLSPGMLDKLMLYHWPGNVRELENVVERAIIVSKGGNLFLPDVIETRSAARDMTFEVSNEIQSLRDAEANYIRRVLEKSRGRVNGPGGAAELLRVNPGTLRAKMKKLGVLFGRKVAASGHQPSQAKAMAAVT